ncbi:MAG: murein biosynthesis integral membrane protein MurJ [Pseudomonadota bacterium]|nr:murein biosynthesis integral membrane protein MurJ [Pseudomonadota bacterium]
MSNDIERAEQNLAAQGSVVASMTGVSRLSGFLRDVVISAVLGATAGADIFFVALRVPNFFRRLFAEGAFAQAFVPVLAEYRNAGDHDALRKFVRIVCGNFGFLLVVTCVVGTAGAWGLVFVFAPGFLDDPEKFDLTVDMVRVTFPYLAFISLTAFAGSILNSFHRYALPAITPVVLNVSLIVAALIGMRFFETPVMALAWGVLAAGILQLIFQLPSLQRLHLIGIPKLDWRDRGARKVGVLLVPAVFAASVGQINILVGSILASTLVTGSISWLYYSDRLMELPIGLLAIALGTVLLPNLSRLQSRGDASGFSRTLDWGVRMGILIGMPAAVALYVLAIPLVATVFYRGAMTAGDVLKTSAALQAFTVGLLPLILTKITAPGYFARQNTTTPFKYAAVSVAVNIVASLSLYSWLGHVGIALATSLAAIVHCVLLFRGLFVESVYRPGRQVLRVLLSATAASTAMIGGLIWLDPGVDFWLASGEVARIGELSLIVGSVSAGYFLILALVGVRPNDLLHRV